MLVKCFTPDSRPYNLSYGQWTVKWWQWLASIPTRLSPAVDETGKNANVGQLDEDVWYLAGTVGGQQVRRKCIIPFGKAILFPVINYEINTTEKPELKQDSDLINNVIEDQNDIIHLNAVIDLEEIPIYRVRPDPTIFEIDVPNDNPLQIPEGGRIRAAADGYWVFLKPLPPGEHKISFSGSCSAGTRRINANYDVYVR